MNDCCQKTVKRRTKKILNELKDIIARSSKNIYSVIIDVEQLRKKYLCDK